MTAQAMSEIPSMSPLHELMLAVPCARCEAQPRERCRTLSGKVALTHSARQGPILEAYAVGYMEAENVRFALGAGR